MIMARDKQGNFYLITYEQGEIYNVIRCTDGRVVSTQARNLTKITPEDVEAMSPAEEQRYQQALRDVGV